MSSVTFPLALGGDGSTITDDANSSTGLANGGHRARFVPALSQTVAMAQTAVNQAAAAAASAASAVNSPGTNATSTTSLTIGTGTKSLTIQTGKSLVAGMWVIIANSAAPTNWMAGPITSYVSGLGGLIVEAQVSSGSGTASAWTIAACGPGGATLSRNTFSDAQNFAPAVSLASATTVNIGAAASNEITVTGTNTITAFDAIAAGAHRRLTFAGALTLTHNASSLILPGGANITTAAGDVAEFVSLGSGNWRCTNYERASGKPVSPTYGVPSVTYLSQSTDIQLVASDAGSIVVSTTAPGINLKMPNATTLDASRVFLIRNTGIYPIMVVDYDGSTLAVLSAESGLILWGTSTATTAGVWANYSGAGDAMANGLVAVLNSAANAQYATAVQASADTAAILYYVSSTSSIWCFTVRLSGTSVLLINSQDCGTSISASGVSGAAWIDATHGIFVHQYTGSSYVGASVLTLNPSTGVITLGGTIICDGGASSVNTQFAVCKLSSTKAVVAWYWASNNYIQSCVLTLSGSSISAGSSITAINAADNQQISLAAISATQAVLVGHYNTSLVGCVLTVSGTTVSAGSVNTIGSGTYKASLATINSTQVLCCSADGNSVVYGCVLTVSGTTFSAGSIASLSGYNNSGVLHGLVSFAGKYFANTINNLICMTVSGTTVTFNTSLTFGKAIQGYGDIDACVVGDKILIAAKNGSSYAAAHVVTGANTL